MKKILQSKVGRIVLIILALALLSVAALVGYGLFSDSRAKSASPYYAALINKHAPLTQEEVDYMASVKRYADPIFFNEGTYKKTYSPKSYDELSDTEKQQVVNWADQYQLKRPAELKENEAWIPATPLAIAIPKNWEQTYEDRKATRDNSGKYLLVLNSKDDSGAFVVFEMAAVPGRYGSLEEYATSKEARKFSKIDKAKYSFADELKRQGKIGFNRNLDNVDNAFNLTRGFIDYASQTLNDRPVYAYQQLMNYTDGQVTESIYLFEIDGYILSARVYYPTADKDEQEKAVAEMISKSHPFNLDYMRKDEPSRHGITKEEEKKMQEKK